MDCLITKLKATVVNDNLPFFDSVNIYPKQSDTYMYKLTIVSSTAVTVTAFGNYYFSTTYGGEHITTHTGNNFELWLPGLDGKVRISNKGAITTFKCQKYKQDGTGWYQDPLPVVNVSELASSPLTAFETGGCGYGDFSSVVDMDTCTNVYFGYSSYDNPSIAYLPKNANNYALQECNLGGNIALLGRCSKFRSIYLNPNITGTIEELVASFVANGRTTTIGAGKGNITIRYASSSNTFGGHVLSRSSFVLDFDGTSYVVVTSGTTVYAKGATAEEIAQWEADGKTVVVVS